MARLAKTILQLEVDDKEWSLKFNGSINFPENKKELTHDRRIMEALIADERLYNLFFRLVKPVTRYKKREAKRKQKS